MNDPATAEMVRQAIVDVSTAQSDIALLGVVFCAGIAVILLVALFVVIGQMRRPVLVSEE